MGLLWSVPAAGCGDKWGASQAHLCPHGAYTCFCATSTDKKDCSRSNVQGGAWGTGPVWGVGKTFPEDTTLTETSISRQGWEKCRVDEGVGVARRPEVGRSLGRRLPETERPRGCGKRAGAEALGGRLGQAPESSAGRVQCSGPLSKGSGRLSAGLCGPVRRTHQNRDSSRRLLQKPGER